MKAKKILLTTVFIALCIFIQVMAQVPTNGLIGYWPFNGNANDYSGNGNNGTVVGATLTSDRFGLSNSAYYLDGVSNYISVLNSTSLNPQNGITLCGWYLSTNFTGQGYSPIIDKGFTSHTSPYYQYKLGVYGAVFSSQYGFASSVATNNVEHRIATPTPFWTPGNWYFLAATYNGSQMKLYVNNQLIQTTFFTGMLNNYNTQVYFGNNTTANDFLKGAIDDIRIYDRALDSSEISQLYNEDICKVSINVTDTLFINGAITGFNPITYNNTIKVYPNPAKDHLIIDNGNLSMLVGYQLKIINATSQVVFQSPINSQQFYISLSSWTGNGLYYIYIIDPNSNIVDIRKIVLQ